MAEIKLIGQMKVKTLKADFKKAFGGTLRVYKSPSCKGGFADDNATLAAIRAEGAKGGELNIVGQMQVGNFEKKIAEMYGIGIQVANADDTKLVDNSLTLGAVSRIAKGEEVVSKKKCKNTTTCETISEESNDGYSLEVEEEVNWWDEFRYLTKKEIEWLNGKSIAVGYDYEEYEDSDIEWEHLNLTDGLDYKFSDDEVLYGIGFEKDNLKDFKIYDFNKDEELQPLFKKLFDDEERFVVNLVLNFINKQMENFPDIAEAIVNGVPISSIIMFDADDNPIVEACSINLDLGYFQSYI